MEVKERWMKRERERSAGRQYLQSESIKAIFIVSFPYYPNVQVSLSPLLNFTAITNQNPHFSFAGIHGCYFFTHCHSRAASVGILEGDLNLIWCITPRIYQLCCKIKTCDLCWVSTNSGYSDGNTTCLWQLIKINA